MSNGKSKGSVPAEAESKGELNESTPKEQRAPVKKEDIKKSKLADGPEQGEFGEYKPRSYKLPSGSIRTDR